MREDYLRIDGMIMRMEYSRTLHKRLIWLDFIRHRWSSLPSDFKEDIQVLFADPPLPAEPMSNQLTAGDPSANRLVGDPAEGGDLADRPEPI